MHFYLFVASFDGCRVRYYRKIVFPKVFNRLEYFGFGSGGSVSVLGYLDSMWKNDDFLRSEYLFPNTLYAASHVLIDFYEEIFGAILANLFFNALKLCHGILL